jgi:hypothetical protein
MYKKIVICIIVLLVGGGAFLLNDKWEAAPVFTYRVLDSEQSLQTYYGVGKEHDIMGIGSLAYHENGQTTWLFWGEYEKMIGQDLKIYAKKQGTKKEVNALKEKYLTLKKGILGADTHAVGTIELPENGLWKLTFMIGKRKLGEIVVKIEHVEKGKEGEVHEY